MERRMSGRVERESKERTFSSEYFVAEAIRPEPSKPKSRNEGTR